MSHAMNPLRRRAMIGALAIVTLFGASLAHAQAAAPANPVFAAVQSADERRYQSMYAGNVDALAPMLADGLLYTHSSAVTDDKAAYLASLRKGNIVYHGTRREGVVMHQHGGTVVMAGHVVIDATIDGTRRQLNNRFTSTWVQDAGQWKLLAWASTAIPKD